MGVKRAASSNRATLQEMMQSDASGQCPPGGLGGDVGPLLPGPEWSGPVPPFVRHSGQSRHPGLAKIPRQKNRSMKKKKVVASSL